MFFSDASNEYKLAAETFKLNYEELYTISVRSIDAIFGGDDIKQELKEHWAKWHRSNLLIR